MDRMALLRAAPVERARPALVLEAHGPPRNRIHYIIVGDGYTEAEGDCDDADPEVYPDAEETPGDAIDSNCDGEDDT